LRTFSNHTGVTHGVLAQYELTFVLCTKSD
jgi:hypothetical protein